MFKMEYVYSQMSLAKDNRQEREVEIKEFPLHAMVPNSKIIIIGKPGCFAPDTEILMADSTVKKIQDIREGDEVMGPDFKGRRVVDTVRGRDAMFRITPLDGGTKYVVNQKHILVLIAPDQTTVEISVREFIEKPNDWKQPWQWFRIDEENPRVPLPVDFDIQPVGEGEYYGFEVDRGGLFLGADKSVLHNTGKSTLIADIIYTFRHKFPVAQIHCGTETNNHFYRNIFPDLFIYDELDMDALERWSKRQDVATEYLPCPWELQILDDCTDDPKQLTKRIFHRAFKYGRHWKTMFILSLQYSLDVKPVIRSNTDYVFIFRETILRNRRSLHENYAASIPDFRDFCDILDQITGDYTALVINNRIQSNDLSDVIFYYKARQHPNFKWGCREYWEWHQMRYNPDYKPGS